MAKPNKSNKITYILIGIGVLLILSGGLYYYMNRAQKDTPKKEEKPYETVEKPTEVPEDSLTGKQKPNPDTPIT